MKPEGEQLLAEGLAGLDITANARQIAAFSRLLFLLQDANARVNLTALTTERDIVLKHFVDSASCLWGGYLSGDYAVIDIGTGAGFPSLPLAILSPDLTLTPLDSIRKKIDFVRATAQTLALANVQPMVGRAETLGQDPQFRGTFDRVVMRAVAALPVIVELALPLLREGGVLVAQKGPIADDELEAGTRAAGEVGGRVAETHRFDLPILGDLRTLVVVEKNRPTPPRYPRREGVPARQPLFWNAK